MKKRWSQLSDFSFVLDHLWGWLRHINSSKPVVSHPTQTAHIRLATVGLRTSQWPLFKSSDKHRLFWDVVLCCPSSSNVSAKAALAPPTAKQKNKCYFLNLSKVCANPEANLFLSDSAMKIPFQSEDEDDINGTCIQSSQIPLKKASFWLNSHQGCGLVVKALSWWGWITWFKPGWHL